MKSICFYYRLTIILYIILRVFLFLWQTHWSNFPYNVHNAILDEPYGPLGQWLIASDLLRVFYIGGIGIELITLFGLFIYKRLFIYLALVLLIAGCLLKLYTGPMIMDPVMASAYSLYCYLYAFLVTVSFYPAIYEKFHKK